MNEGAVHVIGAGLAGLSAAVECARAGRRVVVHEATQMAGGRCRSYDDPLLGVRLDNGAHLLLSGNHAALAYLQTIGARDRLIGPARAKFPFVDLATGERWTLDIGAGAIFDAARRAPRLRARDHLAILKIFTRRRARTLAQTGVTSTPVYERLLHPFLLAALNADPAPCSAELTRRVLIEAFRGGARTCRPLYAPDGLSNAFVDPAIAFLTAHGGRLEFGRRLRELRFERDHVGGLDFETQSIDVASGDTIILAAPPGEAARLVPGLDAPDNFRAIANIHFLTERASELTPMIGMLNGAAQWIFAFPGRISVTISDAASWLTNPQEDLAAIVWREVSRIAGFSDELPPWRVIRERKATFAPTPEQEKRRPGTKTRWRNLFLAGDWTRVGLPATIEGAIRSGGSAARSALEWEQQG